MEIIILRHLKHLKVVPSVKYFGQTLNFDYIIMELLGDNIDVYYFGITEQTLGEIKWIGLKMLNCLKEIHNNGIIHRDIKTDNLRLREAYIEYYWNIALYKQKCSRRTRTKSS